MIRPRPTVHGPARMVLWLTGPIAVLAMTASAAGVFLDATYAAEAPNWATQAVGQDVVNLALVYPALVVLAWLASRGSLRAYLVWLGLLAYTVYSYALYAGFLHFSGWFLVYVAVLGLSFYALVGGLTAIRATRLRDAFASTSPVRLAGGLLVASGVLFALLWLSEIVPAAIGGEPLPSAAEAGLVTNPVHLLDLAIFLPAMVVVGVLLLRRRPLGYTLALPVYVFGVAMGIAVLGMFVSLAAGGESIVVPAVVTIGAAAAVKLAVSVRLLRTIHPAVALGDVLAGDASDLAPPEEGPRLELARDLGG